VIQVGRTFRPSSRRAGSVERERAADLVRPAGTLWIAGALAEGSTRTLLWLIALAIDHAGPLYALRPGAQADPSAWAIETGHFAERFQLFVILALGESIVVTGATAAGEELDAARLAAFSVAFLGTAAMWWLYFDYAAAISARRLALVERRTQMARDAYTYLHVVMVAGVLVAAVGDELVIAHPDEVLHGAELVAVCAGPAI
jgi:low temperature requirement protein LtrA